MADVEEIEHSTSLLAELGRITGDSALSPAQKSAQCRALYLEMVANRG